MSDSFFDVVARQRACRAFSDEPVDDDTIARILTAATFAVREVRTLPGY